MLKLSIVTYKYDTCDTFFGLTVQGAFFPSGFMVYQPPQGPKYNTFQYGDHFTTLEESLTIGAIIIKIGPGFARIC